jgi:hypothetical protein
MNATDRRIAHLAYAEKLRQRKRLRRSRAPIHEAIEISVRMKRSKKKGTQDLDANMRANGYTRTNADGYKLPIEQKFARIS